MRLPSTFFFRLDAHQATFVVATFQFVIFFISFLTLCIVGALSNQENSGDTGFDAKHPHVQDIAFWGLNFVCVLYMSIQLCAMYAVKRRKRCLLVPWLVVEGINLTNVILVILMYVGSIIPLPSNIVALCLCTFLVLSLIAWECYILCAGIASYREMGAANQMTLNRDAALNVPFHQIGSSKEEAV